VSPSRTPDAGRPYGRADRPAVTPRSRPGPGDRAPGEPARSPGRPAGPRRSRDDHDVAIVGGGLGGVALGVALGRQGLDVVVLERSARPPELLRGEAIPPAGVAVLDALGLGPAVRSVCAETAGVELRHPAFPGGALAFDYAEAPSPVTHGLCGWRRPLYEALQAALAGAPGVALRAGWEVAAVEPRADGRRVLRARDRDRPPVAARLVVAADGQASRLRGLLGFAPLEERRTSWVQGFVARAPGFARRRVTVGYHPLGAVFCFPFLDGRVRTTIEHAPERRAELASGDPLATHRRVLREALPDVWAELGGDALEPLTPLQVQPGRSVALGGLVDDGAALVGDAAGCLDPFTGYGMTLALEDAASLARVVGAAGGDYRAARLRAFEVDRHRRAAPRREATELLAWAFLAPERGLADALLGRVGQAWATPEVRPLVAAQLAGFVAPAPESPGERLAGLGLLAPAGLG